MVETKKPLHFEELGPLLLQHIFTVDRLKSEVEQVIGSDPIQFEDSLANGRVTITLGDARRVIRNCEIAFQVPLLLSLEFTLPLLGESYLGTASLALRLYARAFEPAILQIQVGRVRDEDIEFDADPVGGLGLARLGPQWKVIERLVRAKIKSHIDARIDTTRNSRTFYLPAFALEAAEAGGGSDGDSGASVAIGDRTLRGRLEPRASQHYTLVLGKGEQLYLDIYTSSTIEQVEMHAGAALYDTAGNKIEGAQLRLSTGRAWNGEYAVQPLVFTSPATGVYKLRLWNEERARGRTMEYIIRQERAPASAGERLCFPAFGRAFMRSVIAAPVIASRLRRLVPTERSFGLFAPLPLVQAEGSARISVLSVDEERPEKAEQDHEVAFRARLRIDPRVHITFLGMQEVWQLETIVTLHLRAHAVRDPLSILVEANQLKSTSVRVLSAACVEGEGRFNQLNLITGAIGGMLVGQIRELFEETENERIVDLEQLVAESLEQRAVTGGPADSRIDPVRLALTMEGVASGSKPPVYWKTHLARRQKIRIAARWRLGQRPKQPLDISLGVCDGSMGLLKHVDVETGETGKVGHARLSFAAPRSGDYFVRLRVEGCAGDENLSADYQLKVMA